MDQLVRWLHRSTYIVETTAEIDEIIGFLMTRDSGTPRKLEAAGGLEYYYRDDNRLCCPY